MKERPILFSGDMVRAILEGRKTQTRRVIKPQPSMDGMELFTILSTTGPKKDEGKHHWAMMDEKRISFKHDDKELFSSPYGYKGDRLWVRETWAEKSGKLAPYCSNIQYRADGDDLVWALKWKPSIHMPRWASRITLEVLDVRVERVQEISDIEAMAEGIHTGVCHKMGMQNAGSRNEFSALWDRINFKRGFGWGKNPWVWVVEFRRIEQ